jgi:hypothetical protein
MIIILHGDHGGGLHYDQDNKANTCPNERFSPLLAVYATDTAISSEFTGDFNLVNIYRVIFRRILGIQLPNLPNRSTYVSWEVDQLVELEPGELRTSCTAGRKLPS